MTKTLQLVGPKPSHRGMQILEQALRDAGVDDWNLSHTRSSTYPCDLIVTLGDAALANEVPDAPRAIEARGYFWDVDSTRVMASMHPDDCDKQWVPYRKLLEVDLMKAKAELDAGCPAMPERDVQIVTDPELLGYLSIDMDYAEWIALDIENDRDLELSCLGIGISPTLAYVIPAGEPWQMDAIKTICESHTPKVLQNGQYDATFLKYRNNITLNNFAFDTMLAWHCLPGWETVDTLKGPMPIKDLVGDEFWVWSWLNGKAYPAKATAFKTRENAPLVRVSLLRKGKDGLRRKYYPSDVVDPVTITCTPEHRFLTVDGRWVEAQHLQCGDGLARIKFNVNKAGGNRMLIKKDGKYIPATHYILDALGIPVCKGEQVHHIDEDPTNDSPENLEPLTRAEHNKRHADVLWDGRGRRGKVSDKRDVLGGIKRTPEELRGLYTTGLSCTEIGEVWRCGQSVVSRMMKKYGIKARTLSQAQQLRRQKEVNSRVLAVEFLEETADVYCLNVPETGCFSTHHTIVHNSYMPELAGAKEDSAKKKKAFRKTEKSLRFLASIFCRCYWWKDYEFTSEHEKYILCGLDNCLTLEIADKLEELIA